MILSRIQHQFEVIQNQPFLSSLYQALFSTMYYGLLRISEVSTGEHHILARDIHLADNKDKILLILRSSKTHNKGCKPQLVKISSVKKTGIDNSCQCPFMLLRRYAAIRGPYYSENEPFFILSDNRQVTATQVRSCLKLMIKSEGFDESLYDTHELRIGHSCDLLKYGVTVETIKKLGRWKSNTVFRYLRYYV